MHCATQRSVFLSVFFFCFFVLLLVGSYNLFYAEPAPSVPVSSEVESPPPPEVERFEDVLPKQSTLEAVLLQRGFSPADIHRLLQDTRRVYNLHRVRAGQRLAIERLADGTFKSLTYQISDEEYLLVRCEAERYVASRHTHDFEIVEEEIYGRIYDSLYNTLVSQGETDQLVYNLSSLLQWDVDFTAIQPEDSFKLIVEKKYLNGEFVKYGSILAIEFRSGGKAFYGFRFEDLKTGKARYYDEHGKSLKKAFLKVPFDFDPRITSRFSYARYHPILRIRRPHLGVDYGAPAGTPVLASGSGTVILAGTKGGYGKLVEIRHPGNVVTSYAHLSHIYVRPGQKVTQRQRIGRVGSTGLATGPHLDYRVQKDGKHVNPRTVLSYPSEEAPVNRAHRQEFIAVRDAFRERLASIPETVPYLNRVARAG